MSGLKRKKEERKKNTHTYRKTPVASRAYS